MKKGGKVMADDRERQRERDLILSPNEFAFISDQTKGNINIYVGPYKASLSNTDQPIIFNEKTKRFEKCSLEASIQTFAIAPEGWYLILKNPSKDESHPKTGTVNSLLDMNVGHKVNIPGPISFPLWAGQMVNVVQGHNLRSNQYLVARVYDEKSAQDNWTKAVIKTQNEDPDKKVEIDVFKLTLGKQIIIKGTEISFYIPPSGIEVVKDENGHFVREAVTLERLEYCILLNENGNKRFVRGPMVVFPEPTERFIEKEGSRKFRAIELSPIKGIYIKVIAPYTDGTSETSDYKEYKEGDELFITGKDLMIYFPRKEHAIIKYGNYDINYAIAIPSGEARYVMNRLNGEVTLKRGPSMYLPDPREEVIVKRILDDRQVKLWFPGNDLARQINEELRRQAVKERRTVSLPSQGAAKSEGFKALTAGDELDDVVDMLVMDEIDNDKPQKYQSDSFSRDNIYTPPRFITLDTKYEGAVSIDVWTGYAIMIVGKTGERKVIVGPKTYLLEYDENLQIVSLSTGKPKTEETLIKDVYMRVLNNKVSDTVYVESKDFVNLELKLSYRLNFIKDSTKWFNVENYVKFLTDRFRSILRSTVKTLGVEEFYTNGINVIKKTLLGEESSGYFFEENQMMIYDVEIVNIIIKDANIAKLLLDSQQSLIAESATITKEKSKLTITKFMEDVKKQISEVQKDTQKAIYMHEKSEVEKKAELEVARIESLSKIENLKLNTEMTIENLLTKINDLKLLREKQSRDQEQNYKEKDLDLQLKELEADVAAMVEKAKAISPDFISALQSFADKELLQKVAQSVSPLAILGGESVADVFARILKGTKLEGVFLNIGSDLIGKLPMKSKEEKK